MGRSENSLKRRVCQGPWDDRRVDVGSCRPFPSIKLESGFDGLDSSFPIRSLALHWAGFCGPHTRHRKTSKGQPGSERAQRGRPKNRRRVGFVVSSLLSRFFRHMLRAGFGPDPSSTTDTQVGKRKDETAKRAEKKNPAETGRPTKETPKPKREQPTDSQQQKRQKHHNRGRKGKKRKEPSGGSRKKGGSRWKSGRNRAKPEGSRERKRGERHRDPGENTKKDETETKPAKPRKGRKRARAEKKGEENRNQQVGWDRPALVVVFRAFVLRFPSSFLSFPPSRLLPFLFAAVVLSAGSCVWRLLCPAHKAQGNQQRTDWERERPTRNGKTGGGRFSGFRLFYSSCSSHRCFFAIDLDPSSLVKALQWKEKTKRVHGLKQGPKRAETAKKGDSWTESRVSS
jgi:hypothetical protein